MLKACDWAISNFSEYSFIISFTGGGEPLLCLPVITEVINTLEEKYSDNNFLYGLTTNGTLFSEAKSLLDRYKDKLAITLSFDGPEGIQNKQRDNSFSKIPLKKWLPFIDGISMTVTSRSVDDLYNNFLWLINQGVKHISISVDYESLDKVDAISYDRELGKIKDFVLKKYTETKRLIIVDCFYRNEKNKERVYKLNQEFEEKDFSIDYDGNIVRCQSSLLDYVQGKKFKIDKASAIVGNINQLYDKKKDNLFSCFCYKDSTEGAKCLKCCAYLTCVKCKELFHFASNKEDVCRIIRIEYKHIVDYLDKLEGIKKEEELKSMELHTADVFLTDKCNLHCDYCYEKKGLVDMSPEILDKTIDFSFKNSNKDKPLTFWFFGGEPMLVSDLLLDACNKVIERSISEKRRVFTAILTNGTIFDSKVAEFIRDKSCVGLQISLDGIREAHDAHRKFKYGKGSFSIVDANISRYLEYKPDLHIRMTILSDVVDSLSESIAYILDKGVRSFAIMPVHEVEWSEKAILTYRKEFKKITSMVVKLIQNKERVYFSNLRLNSPDKPIQDIPCGAGQYFFAIDTVGDVYPCHRFKYLNKEDGSSFKIGNIETGVDSAKLILFTGLKTNDIPNCKDCLAVNCDRCIAMNWLMNKDFKDSTRLGYCNLPMIHDEAAIRVYNYLSELYTWLASERRLGEYPFVQELIEDNLYGQV